MKDAIFRGKFSPGEKIVEARVCKKLGASRSQVREALKDLEAEDFIRRTPHASAVVKLLSQEDIAQIYDILGALEGLSMRIAVPTITDEDLKQIEKLMENMEKNQDNGSRFFHFNFKFHTFLTGLGRNTRLIAFANSLRAQSSRMSAEGFYNPHQIRSSLSQHRAIFNAIKEGKPRKVENMIRQHYQKSKDRFLKHINRTI